MYSKFFDNQFPLPLHVHHRDQHAAALGKKGKPEAYYFPPQLNNHLGELGGHLLRAAPGDDEGPGRRAPRAVRGGWRQPDHRPLARLPDPARHRLERAGRRPPRSRERLHLRAATRQRRRVSVRVLVEQPRGDERPALEGRARGARRRRGLHRRAARLGAERRPGLRDQQHDGPGRDARVRGFRRPVGRAVGGLPRIRVQREGAHGPAGQDDHGPRHGCLWLHRDRRASVP